MFLIHTERMYAYEQSPNRESILSTIVLNVEWMFMDVVAYQSQAVNSRL